MAEDGHISIYKWGAQGWGLRAAAAPPWRDRVPFGASLASYSAFLGSAGFISMLSVSNPVLRLHLGCLRTCWIELSLQRELDFPLLQELRLVFFFGAPSGCMSASFSSPNALQGPTWFFYRLPLRPRLPPLLLSGICNGSLLALGSLFAQSWVQFPALGVSFWGPCSSHLLALDMASF